MTNNWPFYSHGGIIRISFQLINACQCRVCPVQREMGEASIKENAMWLPPSDHKAKMEPI